MPAAVRGGRGEPLTDGLRGEAHDAVGRLNPAAPFTRHPDSPGDVGLDETHVDRLAATCRATTTSCWAPQGVIVSTVVPDSPANNADIQPGDVIVAYADEPVEDFLDL